MMYYRFNVVFDFNFALRIGRDAVLSILDVWIIVVRV
jgi:hypothetical protein